MARCPTGIHTPPRVLGLICNTETSHLTARGETGSSSSFDWIEPFTALGSVFFVRSKVMNTTDIWDFDNKRFIPLKRVTIEDHAGTFQTKLPFVHHGTFPKEYFVENPKWAATCVSTSPELAQGIQTHACQQERLLPQV